jgi:hypothetical protein
MSMFSCGATSDEIAGSALDDSHCYGDLRQPSRVGKVVDWSDVDEESAM